MDPHNQEVGSSTSRINKYHFFFLGIIAVVMLAVLYVYVWDMISSPSSMVDENVQQEEGLFTHNLILSLDSVVRDGEGIPYSGTVLYSPKENTYNYVAANDGGLIDPLVGGAFSAYVPRFLAIRETDTAREFVVYNYERYQVDRVVDVLEPDEFIFPISWSPNGDVFAYRLIGENGTELIVDSVSGEGEPKVVTNGFPIGFSPDSKQLLIRNAPALYIENIDSGAQVITTGNTFADSRADFVLSPNSKFLLVTTREEVRFFSIDWDQAKLTQVSGGDIALQTEEAFFLPNSNLAVRNVESGEVRVYEAASETELEEKSRVLLKIPNTASVLQALSR